ncbi:MAG: phosphotransferase [Opitutae bacterium]|nr:phosphotransferase [Opitutae bacterium]
MRLSLLLEREPFGAILEATLARYWSARSGRAMHVCWHQPGTGPAGAQEWRGNSYLNYFTVSETSAAALAVIRREFARSRSPWLRPVQAAYVSLATARSTRRWFSQAAFSVMPQRDDAAGSFVVPGNHRLRILCPERNSSVVLLKNGFPARYLAAEIEARQSIAATLAPPLAEVALDGSWFAEGYIEGTPANRLTPEKEREAIRFAVEGLREYAIVPTLKIERASDWTERLEQRIGELLRESGAEIDAEICRRLRDSAGRLNQCVRAAGALQLGTAHTHGDMQAGNILSADDRVWLIDWEGAGRRLANYDLLSLLLDVRLDPHWGENLARRLDEAPALGTLSFLSDWPGVDWGAGGRRPTLAAFILEEMCYVLDDALQSFRRAPTDRLRALAETVEAAEKNLANVA